MRTIAFFCFLFFMFSFLTSTFVSAKKADNQNNGKSEVSSTLLDDGIEKPYLIGLKEKVDQEKFLTKKSLDKKQHKKFKNTKSIAISLKPNEVQELTNDAEVAFIEPDANVTITTVGSVSKKHDSVKSMKNNSQTIPWGHQLIGADISLKDNAEGKNVKIAVFDTGIANHPELNVKKVSRLLIILQVLLMIMDMELM